MKVVYPIGLTLDEFEQRWTAKLLDVPKCMAVGKTQQEALCRIYDVFETYFKKSAESGISVPQPSGNDEDSYNLIVDVKI